MRRRRVKITGVGPVTPAGIGREAFWKGILEPVSRVRRFTDLGEEYGPFVATVVDGFDLMDYFEHPGRLIGAARHTQFALAGASLALADAGIHLDELKRMTTLVGIGVSLLDFGWVNRSSEGIHKRGLKGALRRIVYEANPATIGGAIIERFQIRGKSMVFQSSCCGGLDAVGQMADAIATGEADLAICGGTEAPLHRTPMLELRAAGLTPSNPERPSAQCRPFDLWRTTGVVGEGAAIFILEAESSPRPALAWIDGYGYYSDENGVLFSGLAEAVMTALAEAGLQREQIDSIDAWGPGHREIDAAEFRALSRVFGAKLSNLATFSIKGAIGNPLGAAGAIQIAAGVLAIQERCLPPTVNWEYADPACPLSLSNQPRHLITQRMLVNAHGLSGSNSALILSHAASGRTANGR